MSMSVVKANEIVDLLEEVQDRLDIESIVYLKLDRAITLVKQDAGMV